MKYIIGLLAMLLPVLSGAQSPPIKTLTIGDRVPDITLTNVYNYPASTIHLSDLKGKLVILDFWATWCTACIREFPKLDSLQTRFKDSVQILLVNSAGSNTLNDISQFFEKHFNPGDEKYTFTFAANDTTLTKLFPHVSIPHMVWLYDGKVTAITDGEEITETHLGKVLHNEPVRFDMKEDVMDFDPSKPLLSKGNGGDASELIRRSVFTKYLKGVGSRTGLSINNDSTLKRFYVINQPVLKLYAIALPGLVANRVIIENANTQALIHSGDDKAWEKANFYSYEVTLPATASLADIHNAMLHDLNLQFNLNSHIENRSIQCYALVQTGSAGTSKIKDGNAENVTGSKEAIWSFHNKPISALCDALNDQVPGEPLRPVVLDETNITGSVSIQLHVKDIHDLPSVKTSLHPYGLDIIKVTRTIPMLILSGTGTPPEANTIYSPSN